jgi:pimeloyl-ACP methyl ester carboxylesterase
LLSAHGPELVKSQPSQFWLWLLDLMLASDQLVWLLMGPGMALLTRLMRVQQLGNSLPAIKAFFAGVFPSSDWRAGTQNDLVQLLGQDSLQPEQIAVPTLILHGLEDVIVPPAVAENSAARIPNAQYIRIEGGSHMMMATHAEEISRLLCQFLAANLN